MKKIGTSIILLALIVLPLTATAAPVLDNFTVPGTALVGYQVPVNITILIDSQIGLQPVVVVHYIPPGSTENRTVIMHYIYSEGNMQVWIGHTSIQTAEGDIVWQDVQVNDEFVQVLGETTDLVLDEDKTDPATWAFVIVVLIVVFVIIEMAFKPGRYRPRRSEPLDEPDDEKVLENDEGAREEDVDLKDDAQ